MKVAFMLVFHPFTRFVVSYTEFKETNLTNSVLISFSLLVCYNYQVERGKQVHYCYDDTDLKKVRSSFPQNASYNIQRFKGKDKISLSLPLFAVFGYL